MAANNVLAAADAVALPDDEGDVLMNDAPPQPVAFAAATHQLHLPPFWPNEPDLWFASIEAAFELAKITSPRTRYQRALALLPVDSLCSVRDLVCGSAEIADPYTELKRRLTGAYGKSPWQLTNELLDHHDLGDLKPSVLMAKMLAVLPPGEKVHYIFLGLFKRKLPASWQAQLAQNTTTDHRELAAAADLIWGACSRQAVVAAAPAVPRQPSPNRARSPDRDRGQRNNRRGGRGSTPGRRDGRNTQPYVEGSNICFFHHTFGRLARSCKPPCNWQEN